MRCGHGMGEGTRQAPRSRDARARGFCRLPRALFPARAYACDTCGVSPCAHACVAAQLEGVCGALFLLMPELAAGCCNLCSLVEFLSLRYRVHVYVYHILDMTNCTDYNTLPRESVLFVHLICEAFSLASLQIRYILYIICL